MISSSSAIHTKISTNVKFVKKELNGITYRKTNRTNKNSGAVEFIQKNIARLRSEQVIMWIKGIDNSNSIEVRKY